MADQDLTILKQAAAAIENGERQKARDLILQVIRENPSNLTAWIWALEVAANEKEKRTILNKILTLDPAHQGALRYLEKLDRDILNDRSNNNSLTGGSPHQNNKGEVSRTGSLLRFFLDWVVSLPITCGVVFLLMIIAGGVFVYFRVNTSFFGLVDADFDNLVISNSYESIASEDWYWEVQYEGIGESIYIGTVRHVAPIRVKEFSILTHDILVTTGDFSNPDIVETNVVDHKFIWKSTGPGSPTGSINLIHAIPANEAIYDEMLKIGFQEDVRITGREVYAIKAYQSDETFLGAWIDAGCNTLLVESVTILESSEE